MPCHFRSSLLCFNTIVVLHWATGIIYANAAKSKKVVERLPFYVYQVVNRVVYFLRDLRLERLLELDLLLVLVLPEFVAPATAVFC